MAARNYGQQCGLVGALEVVGERWALLIVRDLLVGPRRYSDLLAGLPRIPTNILAARLKDLQQGGVVRRVPAVRGGYELTERGRALEPVVTGLCAWGLADGRAPDPGDVVTVAALVLALRAAFDPGAARGLPPTPYLVKVAGAAVAVLVDGHRLVTLPIGPPLPAAEDLVRRGILDAAELVVETEDLGSLVAGDPAALAAGLGDDETEPLARFAATFRVAGAATRPGSRPPSPARPA